MLYSKLWGSLPAWRGDFHRLRGVGGQPIVQGIAPAVQSQEDNAEIKGVPFVKRDLNWVRIAQRFPVRIEIENPDPEIFRMGTTAVTTIVGFPRAPGEK